MKDMISEKLIILATAQNRLAEVASRLDKMENSVMTMEKASFELLNNSDKLVNMSKESLLLANRLKEVFAGISEDKVTNKDIIEQIIDEIHIKLHNMHNTALNNSSSSHDIEAEAVCQRENKEFINDSLSLISDSINSAVACADLLLAQF